MKLKYLGTAAYEGVPALFCECEVCKKSKITGGKNIRTRSQAIVDNRLLIDFPADTYMHALNHGINLAHIRTCIVTHDHSDHFYPQDLPARLPGYAVVPHGSVLTIYGSAPTIEKFEDVMRTQRPNAKEYVDAKLIVPFQSFEAEGYKITPLKADHAIQCEPVFYAIEKEGTNLLYANDTGYFPEETWEYLEAMECIFDCVSLDCTAYNLPWRSSHLGLEACVEVKERLMRMGRCDKHTKFILNHFSHNAIKLHDEMSAEAKEKGFEVSYDGMEIDF